MDHGPSDSVIVFQSPARAECMELRLVLESAGIANRVIHQDHQWILLVGAADGSIALAELESYRRDNPVEPPRRRRMVTSFGGEGVGVLAYSATIILVALLANASALGWDWLGIGRMRAGDVVGSGQWWRLVTALTLHVDSLHLMSNLCFGGVFGYLAGRVLGGGVGWLCIVSGGVLGNLINALMRDADFSSIGASTAVFAALGILVASAISPSLAESTSPMKRYSPLIGGALLFAFLGVGGERTDVGAHAAGLVAGTLLGLVACRVPRRLLGNMVFQTVVGFAAVGLVTVAWMIAASRA